MKEYKSFQFAWIIIIVFLPVIAWIYYGYTYQIGSNPMSLTIMIVLESIFLIVLLLFYGIRITLTDKSLKLSFGIGLINKNIQLNEIKDTHLVRNPWYYGFGIKTIPNGMLYNVHGLNAVELTFKNKQKLIRIGSKNGKLLKMEIDSRLIK